MEEPSNNDAIFYAAVGLGVAAVAGIAYLVLKKR